MALEDTSGYILGKKMIDYADSQGIETHTVTIPFQNPGDNDVANYLDNLRRSEELSRAAAENIVVV